MVIKVLLADDHTVLRDGLRYLLEAQGDIEIVGTAANGKEAVEQAIRDCPDVVLMDISMPLMNGIEATQQIREFCPRTQVAILSIHHATEHIQRALQAGAAGYLIKESAGMEVVQAIRAIHSGRHYFSQKIVRS
ncbi:MAG TPA: response regulator transcription factor [Anaerolineales bacterium]|nr:response regulator transcription factor [Anaerolineales bacterium]